MSKAWIEILTGILRIGKDGAQHGDPYHIAFTVRWINTEDIEAVGLCVPMSIADWKAARQALKDLGVKRCLVTRIKGEIGEPKTVVNKWVVINKCEALDKQ